VNKHLVLLFVLFTCMSIGNTYAQNLAYDVTLVDSLSIFDIPGSDGYFVHSTLPNNEVLFYDQYRDSSLYHHYVSKYIKAERRITAPQYLGTTTQDIIVDGAQSIGFWAYDDVAQIFLGYRQDYPVALEHKLRLYDIRNNEFTAYNLSQFTLFDGSGDYISISEDKLMLATDNGLVLYDYINDQSQLLLPPDSLDAYANTRSTLLHGPYGSTILHVDSYYDMSSLGHWYFFNSDGALLASHVIDDPAFDFSIPHYCFRENNELYFNDLYTNQDHQFVKIVVNEDFSLEYRLFEFQDDSGFLISIGPLGAKKMFARIDDTNASIGKILILDRSQETSATVLAEYEVQPDALGNFPRCFATDSAIHIVHAESTQIRIQTIDMGNPGAYTEHVFPIQSFYSVRNVETDGDNFTLFTDMGIYFFEVSPANSAPYTPSVPEIKSIVSFPNPVRKNTGFKLETKLNHLVEIGIYNVRGQLVKSVITDSRGECEVMPDDLTGMNSGIYLLKARDQHKLRAKKFILID